MNPTYNVAISGPSGVGKNTVIKLLLALCPWLTLAVSVTTRARRDYETEGVEYHFISREEFFRLKRDGKLLVYVEYNGELYGDLYPDADSGPMLYEVTFAAARKLRRKLPGTRLVSLMPVGATAAACRAFLETRLRGRNTEPEHVIQERLDIGMKEFHEARRQFADLQVANFESCKTAELIACYLTLAA